MKQNLLRFLGTMSAEGADGWSKVAGDGSRKQMSKSQLKKEKQRVRFPVGSLQLHARMCRFPQFQFLSHKSGMEVISKCGGRQGAAVAVANA